MESQEVGYVSQASGGRLITGKHEQDAVAGDFIVGHLPSVFFFHCGLDQQLKKVFVLLE